MTKIFNQNTHTENRTQHPGLKGYRRTALTATTEGEKVKDIPKMGKTKKGSDEPNPNSVRGQRGKGSKVRFRGDNILLFSSSSLRESHEPFDQITADMLACSHMKEKERRKEKGERVSVFVAGGERKDDAKHFNMRTLGQIWEAGSP